MKLALTLLAAAAAAPAAQLDPAVLLAQTAGEWVGELQYRDYQTNAWQGLPVKVTIAVQGDGFTLVRSAAFDDGPQTGTVWITTVSLLDPVSGSESYASFRKGRGMDQGQRQVRMAQAARDGTHWTLITEETRIDGNSQAQVRETTTRDGETMVTVKEVNPLDDGKDEWLPRNRTVLKRVGG